MSELRAAVERLSRVYSGGDEEIDAVYGEDWERLLERDELVVVTAYLDQIKVSIKEAAERIYPLAEGRAFVDLANAPDDAVKDMFVLSVAYLTEHPADDDTEVTVEWLKSVGLGGSVRPPHSGSGRAAVNIVEVFPKLGRVSLESDLGYGSDVPVSTRRQVRLLCEVLGIELKEQ